RQRIREHHPLPRLHIDLVHPRRRLDRARTYPRRQWIAPHNPQPIRKHTARIRSQRLRNRRARTLLSRTRNLTLHPANPAGDQHNRSKPTRAQLHNSPLCSLSSVVKAYSADRTSIFTRFRTLRASVLSSLTTSRNGPAFASSGFPSTASATST